MNTNLSRSWPATGIILGCALFLLLLLYWQTTVSILTMWSTAPYSHGFLIFPISLYMVWKRRRKIADLNPSPSFWALFPLSFLAIFWFLGYLSSTYVVQQFCLVAILIAMVWGILGTEMAGSILFPLAFLVFAVPFGEGLIPALQDLTASFSVRLLELSGIPVLLQGHVLSVPSGRWEVAEACSGISYLFSSMSVGFLYAGLAFRSWIRRVLFFFASAIVPILANSLRVYTVIYIGALGGTSIALGIEHYLYGWLFFAAIIGLLFAFAFPWREERKQDAAPISKAAIPDHMDTKSIEEVGHEVPLFRLIFLASLALLLAGMAPLSAKLLSGRSQGQESFQPVFPAVSAPWRIMQRDAYNWKPHFTAPVAEFTQSYESGEHAVKLYVAFYGSKQANIKLVSSTNHLFDTRQWWSVDETKVPLTIDDQSFGMLQRTIRSKDSLLLVWNWMWVDGRFTSDDYIAKALLARARLVSSPCGSAAIALATAENSPEPLAAGILRDFLTHISFENTLRGKAVSDNRSPENCSTDFSGR